MKRLDVTCFYTEFFKEQGFNLNSSQMMFEKVFPHGKQVIFIHLQDLEDSTIVQFHLGVRINEVEELIHQFLPTLQSYSDQSTTLLQTPDKLGKLYPNQFQISTEEEFSSAQKLIERFFVEAGFKWLDKMIDPKTLEFEFLMHKEDPFNNHNLIFSAFRSTALSKLYNPEDYPVLRQAFLAKINSKEITPFTIASYLGFLDYLDHLKVA